MLLISIIFAKFVQNSIIAMKYYNTDATGQQQGPVEKSQPTQPKGISGKHIILIVCAAIVFAAIVGAVLFMRGGNNEEGIMPPDTTAVAVDTTAVADSVDAPFEFKMDLTNLNENSYFISKDAFEDSEDNTKLCHYYATKTYYISWPVKANFDIVPLQMALCKVLFGKSSTDVESLCRKWLSTVDENPDEGLGFTRLSNADAIDKERFDLNWNFTIICQRCADLKTPVGMACFAASGDEYTGGAHGMPFLLGVVNYDCKEGHVATFDDIFKPGCDKKILVKLQKARMALDDLSSGSEYIPTRIPKDQMYIETDYITFTYSVYELAPFAEGMIDLKLSRNEVEPYLSDYGRNLLDRK